MPGPEGHAKLSPSAAHRWLTCPGSVAACAGTESPDNEHSLRGTAGHWVFAEWLTKGSPPTVGVVAPNGITITQEIIDLAGAGVGWVKQYVEGKRHALLVEERVEIGPFFGLAEGLFWGTTDTAIMSADGELVVFDLKLGYVAVEAEENEQLMSYGAGLCHALGCLFETVRFVICQPKNGGVKEWVIPMTDFLARLEEMRPKVTAATLPDAPFHPSPEACRYCNVGGTCKAAQKEALAIAQSAFTDPVSMMEHITLDELAIILSKADQIESALKAAKAHAQKLIACGQEVPGWKRVEGRKDRVWKEGVEEQVKNTFVTLGHNEDSYSPRKLVSPAQAEKLLGKKAVEQFITKPKGEPVLAPLSDKRPALPPDFQVLDAGVEKLLD